MSNHILRFRERAGLSKAELARRVGTTRQQMGRLEKDERELTVSWAEKIAPHLHCTPQDLLFPDSISTGARVTSPESAADLSDLPLLSHSPVVRILAMAGEMAGSEPRAAIWFRHQPLPGWAGKTACDLVREGKTEKVLAYLEAVRSGVYA